MEREYTAHLKASNDADGMVEAGVVDGALDLYAQRGEWDKVFEVASKDASAGAGGGGGGGDSLNRYAVPFMQQCLEKGRFTDIVATFTRYGVPHIPAHHGLFARLVAGLLSGTFGSVVPDSVLLDAREMLYRITSLAKR